MIMPNIACKKDDRAIKGYAFAHRGLYDNATNAKENSMRAFENAVNKGYAIELDVQLTRDDVIVVFHDYDLMRMCGVDDKIADKTYKELLAYNLMNSDGKIPTLTDVLQLVNGKVPLLIELKVPFSYKKTCQLLNQALATYQGVYCIESFNPFVLYWYRKNNPSVMRGQLSSMLIKDKEAGNKFLYFLLQNLMFNWLAKPDFLSYNLKHRKSFSFQVCTKLYKPYTFAWTVHSKQEWQESKEDFQYIIFEKFEPRE